MNSTDRKQFDEELAVLFGGFPTFLTPPRIEAYWRGLQKMHLQMFIRCVGEALQDQGDEGKKLPTVNRIWEISRGLRAPLPVQPRTEEAQLYDDYHLLGQRWLFAFLLRKGGVDPVKMPKLIAEKNRIVGMFRADGDIDGTVAEWLDVAMGAFETAAA